MSCASPIEFERLVALCAGELAPDDLEAIELHLFECDHCAAAAERLGELVTAIGELVPPVISHALRDRLAARGTRIRVTTVTAGVDARAEFSRDVDLLVHALRGDLAAAERVDVELIDEHGAVRASFIGVPFDARAGEVLIACQRHYRELPYAPAFHVHAVVGGERREIGRYWIEHVWL